MTLYPKIDRTVSSRDEMVYPGQEEGYFEVGRQALDLIRLAQQVCNREWLPKTGPRCLWVLEHMDLRPVWSDLNGKQQPQGAPFQL